MEEGKTVESMEVRLQSGKLILVFLRGSGQAGRNMEAAGIPDRRGDGTGGDRGYKF